MDRSIYSQTPQRNVWVTGRSPRAEHIIAKESGHNIPTDEPRLIIDGVRRMVMRP